MACNTCTIQKKNILSHRQNPIKFSFLFAFYIKKCRRNFVVFCFNYFCIDMKKLVYLLSILLLPFVSFADLLPEPNDINWIIDNDELISEKDIASLDDKIIEEDINTENVSNEEDHVLRDINVTATQVNWDENWDENLHEIWDDLWMKWLSFWYCNEWIDSLSETLNYAVNEWTPFKVCFMMWNSANRDIKVRIRLVDLVDGVCSVNNTSILQFVSQEDIEEFDEITIPAWNYVIKEFNVLYPIWIQWDQSACTIFNIIRDTEIQWNITAIVNRAYPMHFFVWGLKDVKNIVTVDNIELLLDDNKDLIMNFDVKNEWNLENLVELSGTISNMFGYSKKFSIEGWHVLPGSFWHVEANLWSIPSYGWLFNIDFKAFATPYFSYDISNSNIDPSLIEMKTFDFATTYFKMPWLIIAIAIIVILLLITMFRKPKQKVVYVQQPGQPVQPQQQYYPQENMSQQGYQQPVQQPVQPQVQQPQQPVQNTQQQMWQPVQNYWQPVQQPEQPVQPQETQDPQNPRNPNIQ